MVNSYHGVSEILQCEISELLYLLSKIEQAIAWDESVPIRWEGSYSLSLMDSEALMISSSVDDSLLFISNYIHPQQSMAVNTNISFKLVYSLIKENDFKYKSLYDSTQYLNDP